MGCEKVYKNVIGWELTLDTVNIETATATDLWIHYQKPDGEIGFWKDPEVTAVDTTKIKHTSLAGEIDQAEDWKFQSAVKLSTGFEARGCTQVFHIYDDYE